jgi:hypothetical protein
MQDRMIFCAVGNYAGRVRLILNVPNIVMVLVGGKRGNKFEMEKEKI